MPAVGKGGRAKGRTKPVKDAETPLIKQFKSLKAAYPHAILFFRLGDFYEVFFEDASIAAPVMGVVLTKRQGMPMCGVPHHSYKNYLRKLIEAGHKVAIADQIEDPAKAKGIVKRAVTRVITPGTIVEDELLEGKTTNYLVAIEKDTVGWGLAAVEVSTGEFWATQSMSDHGDLRLHSLLAKLRPAEVLATEEAARPLKTRHILPPQASVSQWTRTASEEEVPKSWGTPAMWRNRQLARKAALTARSYVSATQTHLTEVLEATYREAVPEMDLDDSAIRTLELVDSTDGGRAHTLWGVLDRTKTTMGSRKLKHWILHPSTEVSEIERRHHCVEELLERSLERTRLRGLLEEVSDLERVVNRMATRSATPRDLKGLRDSLLQVHSLEAWLADGSFASGLASVAESVDEVSVEVKGLQDILDKALVEDPPVKLSDGGIIRDGYDQSVDRLRRVKADGKGMLEALEKRERESEKIPLKIGYNSVFGYYIEVTKVHSSKVPARYTRKQTLTNAERYITPELKELEVDILGAEDKLSRLEARLFEDLREQVLGRSKAVRRFASVLAELDCLQSLAETASHNDYVRPTVDLSYDLEVVDGRHPIVEAALPAGSFVPNTLKIDGSDPQTLVLTGPNMGGKSVYLRQNALIAVMAQIGSFIPAASAKIGIVDRVLTRIGAKDQLARGESTFMVEMRETAHILDAASSRSLVLLDEVGRGTSTYDGISIAWAVLEQLNKQGLKEDGSEDGSTPRGPRVLFATHYLELTELADLLPGVRNISVEAREWTNAEGRTEVIFLHRIVPGTADRSFGIHVAELAGLPEECIARAKEVLRGLENEARSTPLPDSPRASKGQPDLPLFAEHDLVRELQLLDPDGLTPREALELIASWKKKV